MDGRPVPGPPTPHTFRASPGSRLPPSSCAPLSGPHVRLRTSAPPRPLERSSHHEAPAELPRTPPEGAAADRDRPPMEYPMKKLSWITSIVTLALAVSLAAAATTNSATPATPAKKATPATPAGHGT